MTNKVYCWRMLTGSDSTSQNPFQLRLSSTEAGAERSEENGLGRVDEASDTSEDLARRLLLALSAIIDYEVLDVTRDADN